MYIREVQRIQDLIQQAEINSAKATGQLESIKNEWDKLYGTNDESVILSKLEELEKEEEKLIARQEALYEKLVNGYDWDKLEEELD